MTDDIRQPKFIHATPEMVAEATKARRSGANWRGYCPCHDDGSPSLSIRRGRNGGTMLKCFGPCTIDDLMKWGRDRGWWFGPAAPGAKPPQQGGKRAFNAARRIALMACSATERKMLTMIETGETPTYREFAAAAVSHGSISPGIRALEALGLIWVIRNPFNSRRGRYDQNEYSLAEGSLAFKPADASTKSFKAALSMARAVAIAARGRAKPDGPAKDLRGGAIDPENSPQAFENIEVRGPTSDPMSANVRAMDAENGPQAFETIEVRGPTFGLLRGPIERANIRVHFVTGQGKTLTHRIRLRLALRNPVPLRLGLVVSLGRRRRNRQTPSRLWILHQRRHRCRFRWRCRLRLGRWRHRDRSSAGRIRS